MSNLSRMKKVEIVVDKNIAYSMGMSVDLAEIKVGAILRRHKIDPETFLSVSFENRKVIVRTTLATIECDRSMITSEITTRNVDRTLGKRAP